MKKKFIIQNKKKYLNLNFFKSYDKKYLKKNNFKTLI